MLLVDEDVGDGRLPGLLEKIGLDVAAVRGFVKPRCRDELPEKRRMRGGTYSWM